MDAMLLMLPNGVRLNGRHLVMYLTGLSTMGCIFFLLTPYLGEVPARVDFTTLVKLVCCHLAKLYYRQVKWVTLDFKGRIIDLFMASVWLSFFCFRNLIDNVTFLANLILLYIVTMAQVILPGVRLLLGPRRRN